MKSDIIERAKNGDSEAFAELFTEVQNELYRVAFIYVKNREDARDVVQETAYRCFRGIKSLKHSEYFKTWTVKTAMNCALNMIRKNRVTVSLDEIPIPETTITSPEDAALASVTLDRLLNVLDEREKSVLILRYIYDLTLSDIAKTLKMPLGTAKTILYRAINKMKKEDSI